MRGVGADPREVGGAEQQRRDQPAVRGDHFGTAGGETVDALPPLSQRAEAVADAGHGFGAGEGGAGAGQGPLQLAPCFVGLQALGGQLLTVDGAAGGGETGGKPALLLQFMNAVAEV